MQLDRVQCSPAKASAGAGNNDRRSRSNSKPQQRPKNAETKTLIAFWLIGFSISNKHPSAQKAHLQDWANASHAVSSQVDKQVLTKKQLAGSSANQEIAAWTNNALGYMWSASLWMVKNVPSEKSQSLQLGSISSFRTFQTATILVDKSSVIFSCRCDNSYRIHVPSLASAGLSHASPLCQRRCWT